MICYLDVFSLNLIMIFLFSFLFFFTDTDIRMNMRSLSWLLTLWHLPFQLSILSQISGGFCQFILQHLILYQWHILRTLIHMYIGFIIINAYNKNRESQEKEIYFFAFVLSLILSVHFPTSFFSFLLTLKGQQSKVQSFIYT